MNSKELKQILESPITKGAKGRFISIEELEQIKTIFEAWEVVKKYCKEKSINGIVFEHIINVSHTKQNYEIVKKALEIEDEQ